MYGQRGPFMRKKSILFLVSVGGYSGAENMTLLIANELASRDYTVYYCSPHGNI